MQRFETQRQAKHFAEEILDGIKCATSNRGQAALECCKGEIEQMIPRIRQVIAQTEARIFHCDTRTEGKIFSLFEPSTEIIRKGKAGKPNEWAS
jgi:transposase, IS5 family